MPSTSIRSPRDRLDQARTILAKMARYWVYAALVVVIGGSAALLFSYTRKRIYRSETVMLYREGIRSSYIGASENDPAQKLGLRLKEMVLSRSRLQKIIEKFSLYPAIVEDRGYVEAVDEMRAHISFRVRDGDTFGLSFEGENPDVVQQVTARLADALIEENARNRAEEAEGTRSFLETQQKQAEEELKRRESEFARFLAKHPEFASESAQSGAGASIRAAEKKGPAPAVTDPTLLALEREAARLRERLGQPSQRKQTVDPRVAAAISDAEAELAAAQRELADKQREFTEAHPDVRAAKARVAAAELRLRRAKEGANAGDLKTPAWMQEQQAQVDRAALQAQLDKLNQQITAYRARLQKKTAGKASENTGGANWIVALETEYERLKRELDEARKTNDELQSRSTTAALFASAETSGNRARMVVVDPAYRPTRPVKAQRALFAGVGLMVSLVLGLVLAFVLALLDDRIYDRFDVERLDVAPLLVAVPRPPKAMRGFRV